MPKKVLALTALCVLILLFMLVAGIKGWFHHKTTGDSVAAVTDYIPGLTLGEDTLDAKARVYRGTVRNDSDKNVDDVEISYTIRDKQGEIVGEISAKVGSLRPHQTAPFQTNAGPKEGTMYYLRELTGTPR